MRIGLDQISDENSFSNSSTRDQHVCPMSQYWADMVILTARGTLIVVLWSWQGEVRMLEDSSLTQCEGTALASSIAPDDCCEQFKVLVLNMNVVRNTKTFSGPGKR